MTNPNSHMLSGFRILDLTRAIAGPTCTRMFAEMGAEVIKVEAAPDGDMTRGYSKFGSERSLHMIQQSLNKKSLCLNLRDADGMAILRKLVPLCDVVVENFRPGIMARMGLDYAALRELREDIILCSISALGQTGPLAESPGYDYIAQAYAGITSMIGDPDSTPSIPAAAIGDVSTGVTAAFAIAAALLDRYKTGLGQHLDVAILDCYYHCHEVNVHQYSGSNGEISHKRNGSHMGYICPAGVFRASGGDVVIMAFAQHWADLCAAMERPELVDEAGWTTDAERMTHTEEVIITIEDWLQNFADVDSAIARLEAHGVPCAPLLSVAQTISHPHLVERGTVRTVNDRVAGEFQMPGHPIHSNRYPANNDYDAPLLGEHNNALLSDLLGLSDDELSALKKAGVLHEKDV